MQITLDTLPDDLTIIGLTYDSGEWDWSRIEYNGVEITSCDEIALVDWLRETSDTREDRSYLAA